MAQDPEPLDWTQLTRYLTGDLPPAEAAAFARWFSANAEHRALLEELRAVWTATGGDVAGWDTEGAIVQLRQRVEQTTTRRVTPRFTVVRRRPVWSAIAAGIVVMIGAGAVAVVARRDTRIVAHAPAATAPTEITTPRGQQATVMLADSSRVMLGAGSRLTYSNDFGQNDRTVTLDGEALFTVVHDDVRPFRVVTAHGVAEDVGTTFVVKARGQSMLQVVVAEGAVVLRSTHATSRADTLMLTRGQLGRIRPDGELVFRSRVDTTAYFAWTRGRLAFDDVPLTDVAAELSRWYDVPVQVADSNVGRRRFSGRFERNSLEETVRLIAAIADVTVRHDKNGWLFK